MGHRHSRDEMLAAALDVALEVGLSRLTFGLIAKRLGTSDRMVVYYLPTKDDLVREVLLALGGQLQHALAEAFPEPADDPIAIVARAWPVVSRPALDASFALYFEAMGLAASKQDPYRALVPDIVEVWIDWMSTFFVGSRNHRRGQAEAALALVDGLLLLRHLAGPAAANRAAKALGVA